MLWIVLAVLAVIVVCAVTLGVAKEVIEQLHLIYPELSTELPGTCLMNIKGIDNKKATARLPGSLSGTQPFSSSSSRRCSLKPGN